MLVEKQKPPFIGVGLRSVHYEVALSKRSDVDFLEIHAENFFVDGGVMLSVLDEAASRYPISLHATALGLGSAVGVPQHHVQKLKHLVDRINPLLVSDHAAHGWSAHNDVLHHSGDLLPIVFNEAGLLTLCRNVEQVQHSLNRRILVENISAYIALSNNTMTENNFLVELTKHTGCGLLLDLNNLVVNAMNAGILAPLDYVAEWIGAVPKDAVGEIHLSGCKPQPVGELIIDDHSREVSKVVWAAYRIAVQRFGSVPTLIEWDTDLPDWEVLMNQVSIARTISSQNYAS
ncbi:MAG: DUF692 domain-containing protein [Methylotenera sp.]